MSSRKSTQASQTPLSSNRGGSSDANTFNDDLDAEVEVDYREATNLQSNYNDLLSLAESDDDESLKSKDDNDGESQFDFLRRTRSTSITKDVKNENEDDDQGSVGGGGTKRRLFKTPDSKLLLEKGCYCLIGEGATFCTKNRSDCATTHRGGARLKLEQGCIFIRGPGASAFVEPTVSLNVLEENVSGTWLYETKTKDDWKALFYKVKAIRNDLNNIGMRVSFEDLKSESHFQDYAKKVKTPFRNATSKSYEDLRDMKLPTKREPNLNRSLDADGLNVFVRDLGERVTLLDNAILKLHQVVAEDNITLSALGAKTEYEVERMSGEIGTKPPKLPDVVDSPSLWSTVGMVSNLAVSAFNDTSDFKTGITDTLAQAKHHSDVSVAKIKRSNLDPLAIRVDDLERFTDLATRRIKELKSKVRSQSQSSIVQFSNTQSGSVPVPLPPDVVSSSDLDALHDKFKQLKIDVTSLKNNSDARAIKFNNLGFLTMHDSTAYLNTESALHDFGYVVDAHIVFEHIHQALTEEDMMKQMEHNSKLKIEDLNQAYAMTSFKKSMPRVLDNNKGFSVVKHDQSHFPSCKDWETWDLIHDGFRQALKAALNDFSSSHAAAIERQLDPSSDYYALSKLSLAESLLFIDGLLNFIDETYREYTQTRFGKAKAWHVATRLAKRLLLQISKSREGVYKLFKTGRIDLIAPEMFYATLRSLDEMMEIRRLNFKNSWVVSSELVKYMASNMDFESIKLVTAETSRLKDIITRMNERVEEMNRTNKTLANKVGDNETSIKNLRNDLASLRKQVQQKKKE